MGSNGRHIFDDTCFLPGFELKIVGFGVSLIAHLCNHVFMPGGSVHQQFRLIKRTCKRFFDVYMFSFGYGKHANGEM